MPLVANTDPPSFKRLQQGGETVIPRESAIHQDIRELHIGLLNMMPDKALEATERQFFRLVGESNQIAQFYVHPFTLKELKRSPEGQAHVDRYYMSFDQIKDEAKSYVDRAAECLSRFPDSPAKRGLLELNRFIVERKY